MSLYSRLGANRPAIAEISDFTDPTTGETVDVKRSDFIHDSSGKRGESSWGTVYEAKYRHDGCRYAIKKIDRIDFDDENNSPKLAFKREMDFLKEATGWQCPNIVRFHGYIQFSKSAWLILDLMDKDLLEIMRRDNFYSDLARLNVEERTCLGYMMLRDISNGLQLAHGANRQGKAYMHRDIKPNNIMVKCNERRLAIIDFGSTKEISKEELKVHSVAAGHQLYLAPECMVSPAKYNQLIDIWSLGITMIRFFSGKHPIYDDSADQASSSNDHQKNFEIYCRILGQDIDGDKYDWPIQLVSDGLDQDFTRLINQCVNRDPSNRPSAQDIYDIASPIVNLMDPNLAVQLFDKFFCS